MRVARDQALAQQPGGNLTSTCRRAAGARARFRDITTLQKFTSVQASNPHLFQPPTPSQSPADIFKHGRAAALAEWRQLAV